MTDQQFDNIEALSSKHTFTIVTAHQPSLFGGPLYYIFKICSVINLCKQLNKHYDDYHFVPTFISGGEDHDFDEIDHMHLYNKTVKWNRDASGPVGRLDLEGLDIAIEDLAGIIGTSLHAIEMIELLKSCKNGAKTYGDFVFRFVNKLFGKYGLIVLDMDNVAYKKQFSEVLKRELLEGISKPYVVKTQEKLLKNRFKAQAFPREINLFYLGAGGRQRIEKKQNGFYILKTDLVFTEAEIIEELENHPENFSPNVIMRPLYQESIVPNLAYIGGGGEIAYWLERKSQFKAFGVFYPMLIRRNSAMILNKGDVKIMDKLNLSIEDVFKEEQELISAFVAKQSPVNLSLTDEKNSLKTTFNSIATKSKEVDPTLEKSVLAEMSKLLKNVNNMESRMERAVKAREDINVKKINKLKQKLFPNNGLQERFANFLPHYISIGPDFFDVLIENLNPMDRKFVVLSDLV